MVINLGVLPDQPLKINLADTLSDSTVATEGLIPGQTPMRDTRLSKGGRKTSLYKDTIQGFPIDWKAWEAAPSDRKNFYYVSPDDVYKVIKKQWQNYFNNPTKYGLSDKSTVEDAVKKFDQQNPGNKLKILKDKGIDTNTTIKDARSKFDLSRLNLFAVREASAAEVSGFNFDTLPDKPKTEFNFDALPDKEDTGFKTVEQPTRRIPELRAAPASSKIREQTPEEKSRDFDYSVERMADQLFTKATGLTPEQGIKGQKQLRKAIGLPVSGVLMGPIYALAFEAFQQAKNAIVSNKKEEKYSALDNRMLSELLPDDTDKVVKVGAMVTEVLTDIAIISAAGNMAKQGTLKKTLSIIGQKLSKAGYGEGKMTITQDAIKRVARGTTLERQASWWVKAKTAQIKPKGKIPFQPGQTTGVPAPIVHPGVRPPTGEVVPKAPIIPKEIVKPPAEPLVEEAKKFKTAEEFTRAKIDVEKGRTYQELKGLAKNIPIEEFGEGGAIQLPQTPKDKDKVNEYIKKIEKGERPLVIWGNLSRAGFTKVVDGNHRLEAYKKLGFKNIPAIATSELTDIWNKAQEGKTDPLTEEAKKYDIVDKQKGIEDVTPEGFGPKETQGFPAMTPIKEKPFPEEELTKERVNKTQILQFVQKAFDIQVRGKATRTFKRKAGHYEINPELIRLGKWGDIEVLSHEVAHHIDKKMAQALSKEFNLPRQQANLKLLGRVMEENLGRAWRTPKENAGKIIKELGDLDYDSTKRRTSEGFAEFVRIWTTSDMAKIHAPMFHKFFIEEFLPQNKELSDKLYKLKDMMTIWQQQGAENRILAQIDFKGEHSQLKGVKDKAKKAWSWILRNFNDEFYDIQKVEEAIFEKVGRKIRPSKSPSQIAAYEKSKAGIIARTFVTKKAVDAHGNIVGKGLQEILKPISLKEMKQFITYAVAKRAALLQNRGLESGFNIDDLRHVLKKYKNAEWDLVIQDITEWSNHLLDLVIEAGGLGQEEADLIRKLNPIYLPFKRAFIDEIEITRGAGKIAGQGKAIKRLKGSGRPIFNPIESLIAQATELVQRAGKIRLANAIADLAETEGVGGFIVKVPAPKGAVSFGAEKLKQQLKSIVAKEVGYHTTVEGEKLPIYGASQSYLGDLEQLDLNSIVTLFQQSPTYTGKDNIVSLWRNGKRVFYELHPDLYKALSGIDILKRGILLKILAPFSRALRLGATGLNVSFGLGTNPFRDALFASVTSEKKLPVPYWDSAKGLWKEFTVKEGTPLWRFKAMGGELSGMMGFDRAATMAVYDDLLIEKLEKIGKTLKIVKHPINSLRGILSFTELAPRSEEFDAKYNQYKKENPDWDEEDVFIAAFNDAQDVTVNFTKSGYMGKRINEATAFFNAAIRGGEKLARSLKEHPVRTTVRGLAFLTLFTLWNWFKNRDKQWYKNLPPSYKYSYFFVEAGDNIYKLPIPFEIGVLFKSAPEAFLDYMEAKDPESLKGLQDVIKSQFPDITPSAIKPFLEVSSNKNYLGIPIESKGMQYLPVTERKKFYTSVQSQALSRGLNKLGIKLSPVQIDHLFHSHTGGITRQFPAKRKGQEPADKPIIGRFYLRMPDKPTRQMNNYYERNDYLSQRKSADMLTKKELFEYNKLKFLNMRMRIYRRKIKTLQEEGNTQKLKELYIKLTKELTRHGFE